jgi:hypothetical protein
MPCLADQGAAQRGGLQSPSDRHHGRLDRHPELARVDEELVPEDSVDDVGADVLVRSVEYCGRRGGAMRTPQVRQPVRGALAPAGMESADVRQNGHLAGKKQLG